MIPCIVCTTGSPSLPVLAASIKAYAPDCELIVHQGHLGSFGADYNEAMQIAFGNHEEILIANDDIVLNMYTIPQLLHDVETLKRMSAAPLGFIGVQSDHIRPIQQVRANTIKQVRVISPVLAWISKAAFTAAQFPPLDWYSDDVMCEDLNALGFRNYVSTAYVHHAGSMTIGHDGLKLTQAAMTWIIENRPQYAEVWFPQEQQSA